MKIFPFAFIIQTTLALAQIQGPQLGFTTYNGELRRLDGLSSASRLGERLSVTCSQVSLAPGTRWAVCASAAAGTRLIDLRDLSARTLSDASSFTKVVWSPAAQAVVVDNFAYVGIEAREWSRKSIAASLVAISDRGISGLREDNGSVRVDPDVHSQDPVTAVAFDGDAVLFAYANGGIARMESGKATQSYKVPFAATGLRAAAGGIIYAAGASRLARVSSEAPSTVLSFDSPAAEPLLLPLADGSSLLLSHPSPGEPGWLFRWRADGGGGAISFIPGIPETTKSSGEETTEQK